MCFHRPHLHHHHVLQRGALPIDRQQGDFLLAIALTTLAATLASILPARRASRIDPVEAIGA